jgi:hypothetical protein
MQEEAEKMRDLKHVLTKKVVRPRKVALEGQEKGNHRSGAGVLFPDRGSMPDRGSVNRLDPAKVM